MTTLTIPKRSSILQTSHEDIKQYYYSRWWPIRFMYRKRLQLAIDILAKRRYGKLLEVGSGGGLLLYSLHKLADQIVASDIHPLLPAVQEKLRADGITNVTFKRFGINDVPYKDETFDGIVGMSILEHVKDLPGAVSEVKRVLKTGGIAVIGFPADTPLMTLGFHAIGAGEDVKHHHCNDHKKIIREFSRQFKKVKKIVYPLPAPFDMYYILRCEK